MLQLELDINEVCKDCSDKTLYTIKEAGSQSRVYHVDELGVFLWSLHDINSRPEGTFMKDNEINVKCTAVLPSVILLGMSGDV